MMKTAIEALNAGFTIFPCEPGGKRPLSTRRYPNGIPWGREATADVDRVIEIWMRYPDANVGIACKPSGLFVVDCDVPKDENLLADTPYECLHDKYGPYVDGDIVLYAAAERYRSTPVDLWTTRMVKTPRGGYHFYFAWPPEVIASQASIVRGVLDVRGNGGTHGGYVLAAGSRTPEGVYTLDHDAPVQPVPKWLRKLCTEQPRPQPTRRSDAPANFAGLVGHVGAAAEGNRNNVLLWAARCMCADGATLDEALELLTPAAIDAGLSCRETGSTIRSAYRLQERKP